MIIITAAVDVADIIETAAASLAKFKVPLAMNVFMHNTGKRKVWYGLTRLRPCDSSLFFSHHSTVSFPFLSFLLSFPILSHSTLFYSPSLSRLDIACVRHYTHHWWRSIELPKGPTGKLDKKGLRTKYGAIVAARSGPAAKLWGVKERRWETERERKEKKRKER